MPNALVPLLMLPKPGAVGCVLDVLVGFEWPLAMGGGCGCWMSGKVSRECLDGEALPL